MIDHSQNLINENFISELKDFFSSRKIGLEKESLRISNSKISQSDHPISLGSPLCNKYITTDFSEAQLEFVTPPFLDTLEALDFLDSIHHFVTHQLNNEILWPFSMPPILGAESDIPIARYGKSNNALFKEVYRRGLAYRYGSRMQTISGIHYNYSLSEDLWNISSLFEKDISSKQRREEGYFRILRNLHRMNWIILYLFGASPVVTKDFLSGENSSFKKLNNEDYYLPFATSLRMSDLGYQNSVRSNFSVSTNSLDNYIYDLKKATETVHKDFRNIEQKELLQLNDNILQIDDEYYAIARPKSKNFSDQRLTEKLKISGVDYIEIRSLDLNPFTKSGIDQETLNFLDIFLIYCFLKPSEYISNSELDEISSNDSLVARKGREPKLLLRHNNKNISLEDWGIKMMDEMFLIADMIDDESKKYTKILSKMRSKILNSEETLSHILLDKFLTKNHSFIDFGNQIGSDNKQYYLDTNKNSNWHIFTKETLESLEKKSKLEKEDKVSFEKFLRNYHSG
tara:strand:- start:660 stop:2201 length:1542 start_codon:yes stop_codon:yes gene_type:complete